MDKKDELYEKHTADDLEKHTASQVALLDWLTSYFGGRLPSTTELSNALNQFSETEIKALYDNMFPTGTERDIDKMKEALENITREEQTADESKNGSSFGE